MINDFLQKYDKLVDEVNSDPDLNDNGKMRKLAELERKRKDDARKLIEKMRYDAVINALSLRDAQNERIKKTGDALQQLDYSRLNYMTQLVRTRIAASENLSDVEVAFRDAKISGDVYALKVWQDFSEGLINERFGGEGDYSDFRGELLRDIRDTKVELIKEPELTETEIKARNELTDVENNSRLLGETLGYGENVVRRVLNGIGFDNGKIELEFDYIETENAITGEKRTESKDEVYYRIEREYQNKADEYIAEFERKGYEGSIDKDFDDLTGAF
jgi:hypothetical protein